MSVFRKIIRKAIILSCGIISSVISISKPENVNILNGNAEDLEAECASYEARMKAVGGVDLFLGGIGP